MKYRWQPNIQYDQFLGKYALLPGDPKRAEYISSFLQDSREISKHREFWTFAGKYNGIDVVTTSTGIGEPSLSMAVHELFQLGVKTFIRVGTCGYTDPRIKAGDIIIVESAVRKEGTSPFYAPLEYPATASFDVIKALLEASKVLGYQCHFGKVLSADSFYAIKPTLAKFGKMVLAFEMECAQLFVQCSLEGLKSGAILAVDGKAGDVKAISRYSKKRPVIHNAVKKEIEIALEAVKISEETGQ